MSEREEVARPKWLWVWLFAMLPFVGWWLTGLFDLDEGFYGAVVSEMNRRGEWITPYFNGHPWFEKPILTYWVAKPLMWLFGDQVGPRLPSVLATAATFGIVIWFARRRMSEWTAARALLILATSLLFVALGRMLMTDPLLDLTIVLAFLSFWESLVGDYRWRWLTAFALGLGVLAKGPVAILLFVPLAGWTFWREPELRPAFRRGWLVGTLILVATAATWYVPAYLANGHEFVQKFLIEQNLNRFTGGDSAHTLGGVAGFVFYVPIMLLGMAPWTVMLWWAWPRRGSVSPARAEDLRLEPPHPNPLPRRGEGTGLHRYLAAWAAIVFLFFTISSAKLPHYVLPCAVPVALLVGNWMKTRDLRWFLASCALVAAVANVGFYVWDIRSGQAEAHALVRKLKTIATPTDRIVFYQLPRRQKALGTGKPKIQETSLPSLFLYLDRPAIETDHLEPLLRTRTRFWVFTRRNRISPDDQSKWQQLGWSATPTFAQTEQDQYTLWQFSPAIEAISRSGWAKK